MSIFRLCLLLFVKLSSYYHFHNFSQFEEKTLSLACIYFFFFFYYRSIPLQVIVLPLSRIHLDIV